MRTRTRVFSGPVALKSDGSSGPAVFTFRASDGGYDRANDRINPSGWDLRSYNLNPIVLFNHDDGARSAQTGAPPTLPIGKGYAYLSPSRDSLLLDVTFDPNDPFARDVERKIVEGILSAVSVRFVSDDYTENERGGCDFKTAELLEVSVVNIPCNPRAVRLKGYRGSAAVSVGAGASRGVSLSASDADRLVKEAVRNALVQHQINTIAREVAEKTMALTTAAREAREKAEAEARAPDEAWLLDRATSIQTRLRWEGRYRSIKSLMDEMRPNIAAIKAADEERVHQSRRNQVQRWG